MLMVECQHLHIDMHSHMRADATMLYHTCTRHMMKQQHAEHAIPTNHRDNAAVDKLQDDLLPWGHRYRGREEHVM